MTESVTRRTPREEGQPYCESCGGTGFVVTRGSAVAARCGCRSLAKTAQRAQAARVPERYRHCTLDTFAPQNDTLRDALAYARRLVDAFPAVDHGLLFTGPCGVGKTHLAVAVLRAIVESRGATALFAEFNDLLRRIQETFDKNAETASRAVLRPALEADVLLLDDLGATRMTAWMQDTLGLIVNERYNAARLTLVTTNRPDGSGGGVESLAERVGERMASRLAEMCRTVTMQGGDFRRNVKAAAFR